jgi:hypothetical protein
MLLSSLKCLSVSELRDTGVLQEINLKVLHPLGLSMMVDLGTQKITILVSDDPEGVLYEEISEEKLKLIEERRKERKHNRILTGECDGQGIQKTPLFSETARKLQEAQQRLRTAEKSIFRLQEERNRWRFRANGVVNKERDEAAIATLHAADKSIVLRLLEEGWKLDHSSQVGLFCLYNPTRVEIFRCSFGWTCPDVAVEGYYAKEGDLEATNWWEVLVLSDDGLKMSEKMSK